MDLVSYLAKIADLWTLSPSQLLRNLISLERQHRTFRPSPTLVNNYAEPLVTAGQVDYADERKHGRRAIHPCRLAMPDTAASSSLESSTMRLGTGLVDRSKTFTLIQYWHCVCRLIYRVATLRLCLSAATVIPGH